MSQRCWFRLAFGFYLGCLLAAPALAQADDEQGDKSSPEVRKLQKQLQELHDEVKALRERVKALEARKGFPFPPGGGFPGPGFPGGKQLKGTVKSFDKDKGMMVLTVGVDSGIKAGQTLMVMKTAKAPQPPTMLEVKSVSGKEVTGQVRKLPFPGPAPTGTFEADEEVNVMPVPSFPGRFPPPFKEVD
jgi:hypothetical protein